MTSNLPDLPETSWKTRTYMAGGLIGLAVGLLSAYFYARASEENGGGRSAQSQMSSMDILKLAVALLAIVRQITDLGSGKK